MQQLTPFLVKRYAAANRMYRLDRPQVRNAWAAVPEAAQGPGRKSARELVAAVLSLCTAVASAGPLGGNVVSGAGSIAQAGATTTIEQSSANLSLSWASFNVGAQETVNFKQPSASAIAVNRIFDVNGSQILGHLNANGQVYLINPNGILFGQGAEVNVGGLVASTLDLNDAGLTGSSRSFSGNGSGSVVNRGALAAAAGGYVALLGNKVSNEGGISARLGTVALGGGSAATLTFKGNSLVRMQVDRSVLNSTAENGGLIRADGGMVLMSAGAQNALLASVVNNTGVIEARTIEAHEGEIILLGGMAAGTVRVGGKLDAGAPDGGDGGSIETSAAQVTVSNEATLTTAAPAGHTGIWLIDPYDVTISNATGNTGGSFVANANDSVINATMLQTALATTNVTVTTSTAGAQAGNITVAAPLTWSAATTLGLTAAGYIAINAPISITGAGGLNLTASPRPGITTTGLTFGNGASVSYAGGGTIAGQSFTLDGNSYTLVYTVAQLDAIDGVSAIDGSALAPYGAGVAGNYALATNLNATGVTYTQALFGDNALAATQFAGRFDGLGHTLTGLTINAPGTLVGVGLIGGMDAGSSVSNIGLVGGSVGGATNVQYIGALVGTINVSSSVVQTSYATVAVTGTSGTGGLVGFNAGTVQASYATGSVAGKNRTGGLVGYNGSGTIDNSYATGAVSGKTNTGGLVGQNSQVTGLVESSYATGSVTATSTGFGGLVGIATNGGVVRTSYWDTQASGQATSAGGTGLTTVQMHTLANFTAATSANGNVNPAWDFANAWLMYDTFTAPLLRSFLTPLVVTATSTSKIYDGVAYSGGNGVAYSLAPNGNLLGTVSYTGLSQGAVNTGSYAVVPGGLYSNQQGYAITYAAGGLTIAPASLTVAANMASRLYGAADPAFSGSVTGFVGNDTLGNATAGSEVFGTSTMLNSNVGSYAINGSGLTANNGNYVFVQSAGNTTALTINPATLTYTSNGASRLYGAVEPAYSGSLSGFVAGDTLNSATGGTQTYSTNALVNSNVGSYAINGSGLTANNGNYAFVQATSNATALTINPATLTYTSNGAGRPYGAVEPNYSGSVSGFVAGDNLGSATTGTQAYATNALLNSNVGSYAIDGSGLTANNGNYVFVQAAGNAAALTIGQATLTYTSNGASRLYGAVEPIFSGTVTGFVAGDTQGNSTTGSEVFGTSALATSNVGSYAINGSGLTVSNGNYVLAQAAGNATALTVTPATLTFTANTASRLYGAIDPPFSGSVSGFVGGDTLANATTGSEFFSTSAIAGSRPGHYAIDGGGLSANNGNYVFVEAPTNVTALTIVPMPPPVGTGVPPPPTGFSNEMLQALLAPLSEATGDAFFLGPLWTPVVKTRRKIMEATIPALTIVEEGVRLPIDALRAER